jgi:hypothetical protein
MDLWDLEPGNRVRTVDLGVAEVVAPTEDGEWILVRYVEFNGDPRMVGTEDLCSADEIEGLDD